MHRGSPRYCFLKWQLQEVTRSSVGFIMLHLVWVVSQFPAQYSSKFPGVNVLKLTWPWRVSPRFKLLHRLRSLIGWLSFLISNMVVSKMNTHEHQTKHTYESYTFQPLMSFWLRLNIPIQVLAYPFVISISTVSRIFSSWKQIHDFLFCLLFRSSKLLILINQGVDFSNIIFVLWCRSAKNALVKPKTTMTKSNVK